MNIERVLVHTVIFLVGITMLVSNRQIGEFADKNLRIFHSFPIPWFPRINAIVIGLLLTIGGLANLIYEIAESMGSGTR